MNPAGTFRVDLQSPCVFEPAEQFGYGQGTGDFQPVAVLDWGIVGRLDADMHHFFRRMIEAVLGDESAWPDAIHERTDHRRAGPGE